MCCKSINTLPARIAGRVSRLREILADIQREEHAVKDCERSSLWLALNAGVELIAIKHERGHGNWGKWLEDNVRGCTARTASKYMRLAAGRAIIENQIGTGADLSIRAALELLRPKKASRAHKPSKPEPKVRFVDAWCKATPAEKGDALATESARGLLDLLAPGTIKDLNATFRAPYERAHPGANPGPDLLGKWEAATEAEKRAVVRNHQDELFELLDAVTAVAADFKTADTDDLATPEPTHH
jgi:hypothetical protein